MQKQICCFSGHRIIPQRDYETIQKRLESEIINLINQGVTEFRAGGALGFDTIAALTVLKLRRTFPRIRLVLVLPCWEQADKWNESDRARYAAIRVQADEVIYSSWLYYNGCMQKRNRRLIDGSDFCICFLTKSGGGSAYTVDYATKKGTPVINIASD